MPLFTHVEIWPPTGWPDRIWPYDQPDEALEDAFLRASRPVCELYDQALRELAHEGLRGMLRLGCGRRRDGGQSVEVGVSSSKPRDVPGEMGFVRLPLSAGELTPRALSQLALATVHAAVLELAKIRNWDPAPFAICLRQAQDADLVYTMEGPWKTSPGRSWQARSVYRLPPGDGHGSCTLELRRTSTDDVTACSPPSIAFSTGEGFKRSIKTLRWSGKDLVTVTPYSGLGTAYHSGHVAAARSTDDTWSFENRDDVTVRWPHGPVIAAEADRHDQLPPIEVVPY